MKNDSLPRKNIREKKGIVLYLHSNLFIVWILMLFWLKYTKKKWPYTDMQMEKGEGFSDEYGHSSLTVHPNLSSSFLKISCNVEPKIISINYLYFVTLNSLVYLVFKWLLYSSCIGHLKNINSLSYAYLPNVETFHYTISKTKETQISPLLSSETSWDWAAVSWWWQIQVFKIWIFTWKL